MEKVTARVLCGGHYSYAIINAQSAFLDVRLEPGRSAAQSLRESATECREKAARLIRQAELMAAAADII